MKRSKHFPAILLALCLTLGPLPHMALAAGSPFTDVPETAWYSGAVQYVYEHGMMSGMGGSAFSPDYPISRAMIVTILHRLEGEPSSSSTAFMDVPDGQWYTDAVAWASENDIINGYGNGNFGPDDPATREQMAIILYRYAGYKGYNTAILGNAARFSDGNTVSSYAVDAVNWAIGSGLLYGSENMLFPASGATRAQVAALLMRFRENVTHSYGLSEVSAMDVMCEPSGIFFLADGSFLVTDTYNKMIWQVAGDSSTVYLGSSTLYAGAETVTDPYDRPIGGYNDAELENTYFKNPWAITPFLDGYAVSDADNNVVRLVRAKITETVNGSTKEDLTVTDLGVAFDYPTGLATDGDGNLYISDTYSGAVRKITQEGSVTTYIDGLNDPMGLCWKDGVLYISEAGANRIVSTTGGSITVVAGSGDEGFVDGPAAEASFSYPQGVAVDDDGTVYVSDTANSAVRQIQNGTVITIALRNDDDLTSFIPIAPVGLAVHGSRLYVCDSFARKVFVISLAE